MQTYDAVGRRKNAVARVRIAPGTGKRIINKVQMKKYLQRETLEMVVEQPLQELGMSENFDVYANQPQSPRLPHPRFPHGGAQKEWKAESQEEIPILQTLIRVLGRQPLPFRAR